MLAYIDTFIGCFLSFSPRYWDTFLACFQVQGFGGSSLLNLSLS